MQMTKASNAPIPPAVNFHLWKPCNLGCTFCFAEFDDDDALKQIRTGLGESDCLAIVDSLASAGVKKLNLVGGEPTLCPHLISVLERARARGMTTSIVTNGFRLANVLERARLACSTGWVFPLTPQARSHRPLSGVTRATMSTSQWSSSSVSTRLAFVSSSTRS
jgi:pyruvate-formate lyase-activating enzyme